MLKQIIQQQANKYIQANGNDTGMIDAIAAQTNATASIVMQILDPTKYADQIAQAQYVEAQAAQVAKAEAERQYQEQKQAADLAAAQAKQAADEAQAKAQAETQAKLANLQNIFNDWFNTPVSHSARSFYIFAASECGVDATTIQNLLADQTWFTNRMGN